MQNNNQVGENASRERKNPFYLLHISPRLVKELRYKNDALLELAKAMYHFLSKQYHPDVNPKMDGEKFKEIAEAWDFVKNNHGNPFYEILKTEYVAKVKTPRVSRRVTPVFIIPRALHGVEISFSDGQALVIDNAGLLHRRGNEKRGKKTPLPGRFLVGTLDKGYLRCSATPRHYLRDEDKDIGSNLRMAFPYCLDGINTAFAQRILLENSGVFAPLTGAPPAGTYLLSAEKPFGKDLRLYIEGEVAGDHVLPAAALGKKVS